MIGTFKGSSFNWGIIRGQFLPVRNQPEVVAFNLPVESIDKGQILYLYADREVGESNQKYSLQPPSDYMYNIVASNVYAHIAVDNYTSGEYATFYRIKFRTT